MKYYELTYLLPSITEEPKQIIKEIIEIIEDQDGKLETKSDTKQIELGTAINPKLSSENISEVLMGTINFYANSRRVNKIEKKISQKRRVLRVMLLQKEEQVTEPEPKTEQEQPEEEKVELEDIDQKLDEILDSS